MAEIVFFRAVDVNVYIGTEMQIGLWLLMARSLRRLPRQRQGPAFAQRKLAASSMLPRPW